MLTMSKEYIERWHAVDAVLDVYCDTPDIDLSCEKFEAVILKIPTADVVEVVRCKDCKWYSELACGERELLGSQGWCNEVMARPMPSDGFCSFGERKNNG